MKNSNKLGGSFRDPSGFLFTRRGELYRQVNRVYADHYERLITSGLYQKLVKAGLLVPHTEVDIPPEDAAQALKILKPEVVPFISYPYEWCFGQLKDAALTTLNIQKRALKYGLSLKDASAYNIQFYQGRPALIDTLSFEIYREGEPWVAYRQFCQHFLAPLALMAYRDVRLGQLLRIYIDGLPLDLVRALLPARTRWNLGLYTHIHLHAKAQRRYADVSLAEARAGRRMSKQALLGLLLSLENTVQKLRWEAGGTEWAEYYDRTNYTQTAFEHKRQLVSTWIEQVTPRQVWDLGANTGLFSRLASKREIYTVAFDVDAAAVERNYQQAKAEKDAHLLPLMLDLTNPSSAMGWHHRERASFLQRGPADLVVALALVHHLAISNNVPLEALTAFFAESGRWLIVEFVPKSDSQVQKLLRSREDIFPDYTRQGFEQAFGQRFKIHQAVPLRESERWLYLMEVS